MEILDALKRIGKLPGGKKDPFADPYGPTSNCFSSNDIARMFQLGATLRDRAHFTECSACRERIVNYAEAIQPTAVPHKGWFGHSEPIRAVWAPKALVYSPTVCVVNQRGIVPSIAVEILTNVSPELYEMKLTLNGPVVGSVVPNWEGKRFQIHDVPVSPEVVRILRGHQGYMQPVQLQFGASADAPQLIANCSLEFSRTAE
jgi:hypothetical protein